MKNIVILGSTGNIGLQTLDVVRKNRDRFSVTGLSCHSNIDILEQQIREFDVTAVAVYNEEKAKELRCRVSIDVLSGMDGLIELTKLEPSDVVLNSLVGSIGIEPTLSAIKMGKDIALANKETLVTAGEIVMDLARQQSVTIFPVDSEHSAIYQCLQGEDTRNLKRIILTCSGGAFRDKTIDELYTMKPEDALKHPSWDMGAKITIDSATLMNKGLEVIEAKILFDCSYDDIDVVIHPQSIIHSLVEYSDNSVIAQLSNPDMRLPIQYALTYPDRSENDVIPLDLTQIGDLSFSAPKADLFPCLGYAFEAGRIGGTMPCVLNAANEVAVNAFLKGQIDFMDIPGIIKKKMDDHIVVSSPSIEEILHLDTQIRKETAQVFTREAALHG